MKQTFIKKKKGRLLRNIATLKKIFPRKIDDSRYRFTTRIRPLGQMLRDSSPIYLQAITGYL